MAGLKGLTINTAPEAEPHMYAEDDAAIYQAICGPDGVFQIGQQCESQVISNNKVRVKDGVIIVGGHFARIPYGDYIDFEIANGQTGKKRNDILIAKFVTTGSGGIDTFTGEVKQGAAATGEATDPALTQNDLYQGGKIREMPLYRVKLDGLSITEVEPMFDLIPTIPTLNSYLSETSITKDMFAFETFYDIVYVSGKKIGKTLYFSAELLYTGAASTMQPNQYYKLNRPASVDPAVKPKNFNVLNVTAVNGSYTHAINGFAQITKEGLIEFSLPEDPVEPTYIFISGIYETAN